MHKAHTNVNLKVAIILSGRDQYQLAEQVGITETHMSRIVRGRLAPTESEAKSIAQALDKDTTHLFAGKTAEKPTAPHKKSTKKQIRQLAHQELLTVTQIMGDLDDGAYLFIKESTEAGLSSVEQLQYVLEFLVKQDLSASLAETFASRNEDIPDGDNEEQEQEEDT